MRLLDYLEARGEKQAAFARRCGVDQRTVNRICLGDGCSAATAHLVIKASREEPAPDGGTVTLEDLVDAA